MLEFVLSSVLCGIDVLERNKFDILQGQRIAIITNHTGTTADGRHLVDVLMATPGVKIVALFAPEHGIRGDVDVAVSDSKDAKTGLPIYSLYNLQEKGDARYKPKPEQLQGIDTIVFDIQDIGTRFYTYTSTMGYAMEAARDLKLRFVVLDRPNPIGGVSVEGPVAEPSFKGHTGFFPLPLRHGMTAGELARLYNGELDLGLDLTVVWAQGWRRSMWWDATGLVWTNPSPNMRSVNQATLYPGIGLIEATNISVGRGTDTPFEWIGAPYIDGRKLADAMNRKGLPGIRFYPVAFTPKESKFKGERCQGVNFIVTDREALTPVRVGCELAYELQQQCPEWQGTAVVNLMHHRAAAEAARTKGYEGVSALTSPDLKKFMSVRTRYLHYPE